MLIVLIRGKMEENVLSVCKEPAGSHFFHKCVPPHGPQANIRENWYYYSRPLRRIGKS